jgi:aldehyde dehydrogenase (NAD+)
MHEVLDAHKEYYKTRITRNMDFRINNLTKLKLAISKYEDEIMEALRLDLGKPAFEAYATEIGFVKDSINFMTKHLKKWAKQESVKSPIHQPFTKSFYLYEPYGTVLIIGPFNYPFQLLIEPMIGAMAAGNTVVLKPSEYTVHVEKVVKKMMAETFPSEYVTVITGGQEVTSALIHSKFDYIFFTGSVGVGKIVMEAAAKNLTPVTLELGGKSPAIVHKDANLKIAAKRIAWGKFINTGQTCIAPDYVYVHEAVKEKFLKLLSKYIQAFYGREIIKSKDYGRIVSKRHFDRLIGLIEQDKVYCGGHYDGDCLYIEPTVLRDVTWEDSVMSDEIFGPILPVLSYGSVKETFNVIQGHEKPLALYLFTENEKLQHYAMKYLPFGGGCINDTISHVASPYLPFGGVGHSGMGAYHGKDSFLTFSHRKSVIKKATWIDVPLIYPPYRNKVKLVKKIMK